MIRFTHNKKAPHKMRVNDTSTLEWRRELIAVLEATHPTRDFRIVKLQDGYAVYSRPEQLCDGVKQPFRYYAMARDFNPETFKPK